MIKNQRQYEVTRAQAAEFERALASLDPSDERLHPRLRKAKRDALQSQLDELRGDILEYEALQSGATRVLELTDLGQVPAALIQARIAAHLSQKELAERLGLKEQQIQRYEATNYAGASLERICEVMAALGVTVRKEIFLPSADVTLRGLLEGVRRMGLDPSWVQRVLPSSLVARLSQLDQEAPAPGLVLRAAGLLGRIFNIRPMDFFTGEAGRLALAGAGGVRFKLPARADVARLTAYTVYARYLADLVLVATAELVPTPVPTDPGAVYQAIVERYGAMTFRNALCYVWDLGIPVLPLQGVGAFHGACWRAEGRNIIVLKQSTGSAARWLFDLIHELRHAAERPDETEFGIVEEMEIAMGNRDSVEERIANEYAGNVSLAGRGEDLVHAAVERAHGSVERLKSVVPRLAHEAGVSVGALANYVAYRLDYENIANWWGAAQNLQEKEEHPWEVARDELIRRADLRRITEPDRDLLLQALSNIEGA